MINASDEYTTESEQLNKILKDDQQEIKESVKAAGYDLLGNSLIYPDNDIKATMNAIAQAGLRDTKETTSAGMRKVEKFSASYDDIENFMQAPSAITYSSAGSMLYEHPDMNGFNDRIYSNPGRTIGIADPQQAVIHFNESAAYYGNVQQTLPVSIDSSRWNAQYNPQMGASEYFDIQDKYSLFVDDPRQPVASVDYASSGNGPVYKKRMNMNDAVDEMNRKRNDLLIGSAERGERVSKDSRNIMNTVFSPDMDRYEKSVWYSHYEV